MICPKCSAELKDGVVFCCKCGARVDGKKSCPNCYKLINEADVFCEHCGARVDGKTICSECGAVLEGDFCSMCGASSETTQKKTKTKDTPIKKEKNGNGFKRVAEVLVPSLLLGAILTLFICSFFVGIKEKYNGVITNSNAIKVIDSLFKGFSGQTLSGIIPILLTLIAVLGNLIVCLVLLIISIIKFIKAQINKESVNLSGYFAFAFASFILASFSCVFMFGLSIEQGTATAELIMSSGAIVGMVIASILGISAYVLNLIANKKELLNLGSFGKSIALICGSIFGIITLALLSSNIMDLKVADFTSGNRLLQTVGISTGALGLGLSGNTDVANVLSSSVFSSIFCFASMVVICLFIAFAIKSIGYNQQSIGAFTYSIIGTGCAIIYMLFAFLLQNAIILCINNGITIGINATISEPIIAVVLSVFVLVSGVLGFIFSKKQKSV